MTKGVKYHVIKTDHMMQHTCASALLVNGNPLIASVPDEDTVLNVIRLLFYFSVKLHNRQRIK